MVAHMTLTQKNWTYNFKCNLASKNCIVKVTSGSETSADKKLTIYLDGTEISVKEIKLTNGTSNQIVSESSLTSVTQLTVVLNGSSVLNATIQ